MSVPRQSPHLRVALFPQRAKTDHLPLLLVSSHSPGLRWTGRAGSLPQHPADTWQGPAHREPRPGVGPAGSLAGRAQRPSATSGGSQCSQQPKQRAEALLKTTATRTALHLDLRGNDRPTTHPLHLSDKLSSASQVEPALGHTERVGARSKRCPCHTTEHIFKPLN